MKIMYFTTTLEEGGAEKQLFQLINGIVTCNNKIDIKLISIFDGNYNQKYKDIGISVKILSLKKNYNIFQFVFLLIREIKKFNPDIIHSFLFHSNIVSKFSLFFIKKNFKLICSYRGIIQKYKIIKYLEYFNMKKVDVLISNSQIANKSLSIYKCILDKRVVIQNGFIPKKVCKNILNKLKIKYKNKKVILTIGAFRFEKDYNTNVLVAREVIRKYNGNVVFLYVGEKGPIIKEIEFLIEKYHLNGIEILGRRDDIVELLTFCDILFLPSLFESQPNVIMEGMYYEKPIVTTNISAITTILKKAKFSKPKNVESMVSNILFYLNNEISENDLMYNKKCVENNFSNKMMIQKYYKVYNDLLSR